MFYQKELYEQLILIQVSSKLIEKWANYGHLKNSNWPTFSRHFEYLISFQNFSTAKFLVITTITTSVLHYGRFHYSPFANIQTPITSTFSTDLDKTGIKIRGLLRSFI